METDMQKFLFFSNHFKLYRLKYDLLVSST